jgi:hypothetical protein
MVACEGHETVELGAGLVGEQCGRHELLSKETPQLITACRNEIEISG